MASGTTSQVWSLSTAQTLPCWIIMRCIWITHDKCQPYHEVFRTNILWGWHFISEVYCSYKRCQTQLLQIAVIFARGSNAGECVWHIHIVVYCYIIEHNTGTKHMVIHRSGEWRSVSIRQWILMNWRLIIDPADSAVTWKSSDGATQLYDNGRLAWQVRVIRLSDHKVSTISDRWCLDVLVSR